MKQDNFCCGAVRQGNFCQECGKKLMNEKSILIQDLMGLKLNLFRDYNLNLIEKTISWIERAEIKSLDTTA